MKEEGKRANDHLNLEPVGSSSFPPMEKNTPNANAPDVFIIYIVGEGMVSLGD